MSCQSLWSNNNGMLSPIIVDAPGGGYNPEFNAIFARNLGFGPPPTGAQPMAPPPQHNYSQGTFDMGGGAQLRVKINGMTPENYVQNQASSMIWGWIIGAVIIGLLVLVALGVGGYVWFATKNATAAGISPGAAAAAAGASWDGKSSFSCAGNDHVALTNVTAAPGVGVSASGNCQLVLANVTLSAPVAIEASGNAHVAVSGGSITGTTHSASATGNAQIVFAGSNVSGKSTSSGNGRVIGAP
jgi:hypothetical protein